MSVSSAVIVPSLLGLELRETFPNAREAYLPCVVFFCVCFFFQYLGRDGSGGLIWAAQINAMQVLVLGVANVP